MDKYYRILGLEPGAAKEDIKRAYRKLAMQYHPDLNPGPESKAKFLEILEAYEYLTGIRKTNANRLLTEEEKRKIVELMIKIARERAREKYLKRVQELRKEKERKQAAEYRKGIFSLIGLVIVAVAIWQGYGFYQNLMINSDPVAVEAEVIGLAHKRVIYQFLVGDSLVQDREYVNNYGLEMISGNGMPLKSGDRFELIYSNKDPSYHKINFDRVSSGTLKRYIELVSRKLMFIYRNDWKDLPESYQEIKAQCITLLVLTNYGFDGLATVYYHDGVFLDNFSHNSIRWRFMRNSDDFQSLLQTCEADSVDLN